MKDESKCKWEGCNETGEYRAGFAGYCSLLHRDCAEYEHEIAELRKEKKYWREEAAYWRRIASLVEEHGTLQGALDAFVLR